MIVHEVKIGNPEHPQNINSVHRNIYVSSALTDLNYQDMLVFFRHRIDLYLKGSISVSTCDRKLLTQEQWKQKAEQKIRASDGVMILVSENTVYDPGVNWEIDRALLNDVPITGVDIRKIGEGKIPIKLEVKMIRFGWEWFVGFINGL